MGFVNVMCYPPEASIQIKKERKVQGTLRIYRQQIMFGKKWQTQRAAKPVDSYSDLSLERSINTCSLQHTITLSCWPDVRGQGFICLQRTATLQTKPQVKPLGSPDFDFLLASCQHTSPQPPPHAHTKKIPLLQHNLGAIHQIRHRIN